MDIVFGNLSWLRFAKLDNNLKDLTIFISPTTCPRSTVTQRSDLVAIVLSLSFCLAVPLYYVAPRSANTKPTGTLPNTLQINTRLLST